MRDWLIIMNKKALDANINFTLKLFVVMAVLLPSWAGRYLGNNYGFLSYIVTDIVALAISILIVMFLYTIQDNNKNNM